MKLSKVTRVLDRFKIAPEELSNYTVDNLDINRVPNPKANPKGNPVYTQVNLLHSNGQRTRLKAGERTSDRLTDDTLALHVEMTYRNNDTESKQQLLLIR